MCGIIAVVRRQPTRQPVAAGPLADRLADVAPLFDPAREGLGARLDRAATALEEVDRSIRGVPGLLTMLVTLRPVPASLRSWSTSAPVRPRSRRR